MNAVGASRYAPEWLSLREGADVQARSSELLEPLRAFLAGPPPAGGGGTGPLTIRDLGCGTGSMGRWLASRLDGPQRWIMYDRDPDLLAGIASRMPDEAADGSPVEVVPQERDVTGLTSSDLAGTSVVVASALLDLLTAEEVARTAAACTDAGCAVLFALSVEGRVELDPADPLDGEMTAAFNAHQRRTVDGRRLLGPDAVEAATSAFELHGATVRTHLSPWRLGPQDRELTAEWLRGWVGAALAQRPDLRAAGDDYLRRRLGTCEAGGLRAVVHHRDLLALPEPDERV
ncbi:class I SAM-dependent methyltransferase [Streptomyces ovatisporus]|uniref:Class I SAM-dependent methyltransferase n=1 Tax=Streptomyces ovatisporus TaxID=1128682 RepID=A0ABV9ACR8_9ACTN